MKNISGTTRRRVLLAACWLAAAAGLGGAQVEPSWSAEGHADSAAAAVFSPAGDVLATAGHDRAIKLWQASDGAPLRSIDAGPSQVTCLAFSPDGEHLVSGNYYSMDGSRRGGTISLWQVSDGSLVRIFETAGKHIGKVNCVAVSPDGTQVASGGSDWIISIWDLGTGEKIREVEAHWGQVSALAYSADGSKLFTSGWDERVKVIDTATWNTEHNLRDHDDIVLGLCAAGGLIAAGGADMAVNVWDASSGALTRSISAAAADEAVSVSLSPDGGRLALAAGGVIEFWDLDTGELLQTYDQDTEGVLSVAFSPDGAALAYGLDSGAVGVAEVPEVIEPFEGPVEVYFPGAVLVDGTWHWVDKVGWIQAKDTFPWIYHPNLRWIYCAGPGDGSMWWWLPSGKLGWCWTNCSVYPFMWKAAAGSWLFYFTNSANPPCFYDYGADALMWAP